MKKIEYKENIYDVPETIWEMNVGQFVDVYTTLRDSQDRGELEVDMELISLVCGLPMDEIKEMSYNTFLELTEQVGINDFEIPKIESNKEAGTNDKREPVKFSVGGEEYIFQPDYVYTRMETASKVEDYLSKMKDPDIYANLHYILAIAARKEGEIYSNEALNEKAVLMCSVPMSDVYKALFFFAQQGETSLMFTKIFGRMAVKNSQS